MGYLPYDIYHINWWSPDFFQLSQGTAQLESSITLEVSASHAQGNTEEFCGSTSGTSLFCSNCIYSLVVLGGDGIYTPWKINMEHNPGGLEDDIPFQMGDL